jgi:negative regulator of replication initiation
MRLMSKTSDREIEQIIRLMRRDASYDAPEDAVRWSKNIFRSKAAAQRKSLIERVAAVLQIDLSPNRAAFGERSASAGQARQMLFQAGDASLDLRIRQEEKARMCRGRF